MDMDLNVMVSDGNHSYAITNRVLLMATGHPGQIGEVVMQVAEEEPKLKAVLVLTLKANMEVRLVQERVSLRKSVTPNSVRWIATSDNTRCVI